MQRILAGLLAGLILACPLLCGAAEADHVAHQDHPAKAPADQPTPAHCPQESDDCICEGAVQAASVRLSGIDHFSVPLPSHDLVSLFDHSRAFSKALAHLTIDGTPTGLASWGDAATIRALLQNFRF